MIRRSKPNAERKPGVRPALSRASWAVEDRLVWGGADVLRSVFEAIRWPFERVAWTAERRALWPLQKRTAGWSDELRAGSGAALVLLAIGAGVLGLILASGSGGGGTKAVEARSATPLPAPVVAQAPRHKTAQAAPILHGAPPDFTAKDEVGAAKAVSPSAPSAGEEATGTTPTGAGSTEEAPATASAASPADASAKVVAVGPAATEVAHRFAGAFVHFETGQVDKGVRNAFASTATPELARSLLHRPPRLPANVKVPRAKVLNIVPGPKHGDAYTLSVSLLRVGITSELRIEMERDPTSHEWLVTDVLG